MRVDGGESDSEPIIDGTMSSSCKNDALIQFEERRCTADVVSVSSCCDDDNAYATSSGGELAYAQLKMQSKRQKTTLAELEKKKRKEWSGGRKSWLSVLEDCFSLSSLEVDLGSEYEIDDIIDDVDDVDHEVDEPSAEDRFRSSSGRDSMDSIPAQPLSSERDVRRVASHGELRQAWVSDEDSRFVQGIGRCCSLDFYVSPPKDLGSALRESRWSSSSDMTMRQDALNVLLDRVASSHHEASYLMGSNDEDEDGPFLTRRQSMADCEDRLAVPQSRKGSFPVLSRRISSPHDHRWQGGLSISPQDSAIQSPTRFRRARDH